MHSPQINTSDDMISEDPTSILRVFGDFNSRVRSTVGGNSASNVRSIGSSILGGYGSTSTSQRLRFENSAMFETPSIGRGLTSGKDRQLAPKRDYIDPFEGLEKYGINTGNTSEGNSAFKKRKRYPSCEEHDALKLELERLKMKLVQKEGECMEALGCAKKSEASVRKMELTLKEERMQMETTIEKVRREARQSDDKVLVLKANLDRQKRSHIQEKEDESFLVKEARLGRVELEDRISELMSENSRLQEENEKVKHTIDVQTLEECNEVLQLKREMAESQSFLQEEREKNHLLQPRIEEGNANKIELEKVQSELMIAKSEIQRLENELQQNDDAVIERKAMRHRLDQYPQLVEENENLRKQNKLLFDTADNCALLKTKAEDLELKLNKAVADAENNLAAKEKLVHISAQIKHWKELALQMLTAEERASIGDENVGVEVLRQKIAEFQQKEISTQVEMKTFETKIAANEKSILQMKTEAGKRDMEVTAAKENLTQQASLIKRFKRKLLLVSKERDSYKGVLDTYEHELTFTGKDFEKDRLQSLENVVLNYREMVEGLENQLAKLQGVSHENITPETNKASENNLKTQGNSEEEKTKMKMELEAMENRLSAVLAEKENLQYELERRAIQGDYNPLDTKVLHFKHNPMQQATEEHKNNLAKLQDENDRLKARIKLLEEGQSKDLTLLVGHKLEENATSQEVQDLKEQLKSKDLQKQRLLEAFTNTSKNFREVCCQLTGYRIDGLQNNQYRLTPHLADNPSDDNLLFRREEGGELSMLDTPFSGQLTDFIELHLNRQNSIPVFLAAVIMDLFSRQTFDTLQDTQSETAPSEGIANYTNKSQSAAGIYHTTHDKSIAERDECTNKHKDLMGLLRHSAYQDILNSNDRLQKHLVSYNIAEDIDDETRDIVKLDMIKLKEEMKEKNKKSNEGMPNVEHEENVDEMDQIENVVVLQDEEQSEEDTESSTGQELPEEDIEEEEECMDEESIGSEEEMPECTSCPEDPPAEGDDEDPICLD